MEFSENANKVENKNVQKLTFCSVDGFDKTLLVCLEYFGEVGCPLQASLLDHFDHYGASRCSTLCKLHLHELTLLMLLLHKLKLAN